MSKKNNKHKEASRLQNLYQPTSDTSSTTVDAKSETKSDEASEFLASSKYAAKHITIKKDLVFLSILIVFMVALLFALNYLITTTSFGDWVSNFISKLIESPSPETGLLIE